MDVILTAGGVPSPKDSLHTASQGGYKAMINLNGRPMIQWVLDALSQAKSIERIILVGLPPMTNLYCAKPIIIVEEQGDLLSNVRAGCHEVAGHNPSATHTLLVAADIPLLTPEMVDWMASQVAEGNSDMYYALVERNLIEKAYPGARKVFISLKDLQVCSGEVNAIRLSLAVSDQPFWQRLVEARKNPLKLASVAGYDTMFLLRLGTRSLDAVEKGVQERFGFSCRALLSPYPEIAVDVDKPFQLEIASTALRKRAGASA